jgi:hypothetical protein
MKKTTLILFSSMLLWNGCTTGNNDENLNIGKAFILCEGNFGSSNAALWSISPEDSTTETQIIGGQSLGDVAQSLTLVYDKLYVVVNNSHKIEVFSLGNDISHEETIVISNGAPRYFVAKGDTGYVSCWNLSAILILDLITSTVIDTIPVSGMPEYLVLNESSLYVSIPLNSDWSSSNFVVEISTSTKEIIHTYEVVSGPSDMELIGSNLFISSTYYGDDWSIYTGLSKINLSTGTVMSTTYNDDSNSIIKNDLVKVGEALYRSTTTGLARVNDDLSLDLNNIIGGQTNVYSVGADENYLYFGSTDYVAPDTVYVTNHSGASINNFIVGAIPGDFAIYTE